MEPPKQKSSQLTIQEWKWRIEGKFIVYKGIVKNHSRVDQKIVQINMMAYDAQGKFTCTGFTFVSGNHIAANGQAPFKGYADYHGDEKRLALEIAYRD